MSSYLSITSLMRPTVPIWLEDLCQRLHDNDGTLHTVEVTHPRIDDVLARILAQALPHSQHVTSFIFSCGHIVDDGAHALGAVLRDSRYLEKVQLRDLRDAREINTFFHLLASNTSIRELSLRHCRICVNSAPAVATFLRQHRQVRELRLVDCQVPPASLALLCQALQQPSDCNQHDPVVGARLERLHLVNAEIDAHGAIELADMLARCSTLRELHLCENRLGDDGVVVLAAAMRNCGVHTLDLRANELTSNGSLAIQGMILSSSSLRRLCLADNALGDSGAAALARGLQQQKQCHLTSLDLRDNDIGPHGCHRLATMLHSNTTLRELDLSFNTIGDRGATQMARALTTNASLHWLSLRRCSIGNVGAYALARQLPYFRIKELLLSKNLIDHDGATAILHSLRSNVQLEYLVVEEKVSEPIAREIVHWIRLNKAGRRIFRQPTVPDNLWPSVYGRISQDSNVLFHFLLENSRLLATAGQCQDDTVLLCTKKRKLVE